MNGVEPYPYLKTDLEAIAAGHPALKIDQLCPGPLLQILLNLHVLHAQRIRTIG